jgi:hypothetical protein
MVKAEGTRGTPWTTQHTFSRNENRASCGCIGPARRIGAGPSPRKASLRWPLDLAHVPSVHLIEAAWRRRDGRKKNTQCRVQVIRASAANGSRVHEGMGWGAAAYEKNGAITSKK